jgi:hypothetical protein
MQSRSMVPILVAVSLGGVWALPAAARQEVKPTPAQPPAVKPAAEGTLPTGEELFKRHIAALGGEEALRAEKNRVTKGRLQPKGQPSTGQITILRVAPNRMYSTLDLPGVVTIETWCDGERAWVRDSNSGARVLTGEALADTKRSADFLGEANYKDRYTEIKTVGREKLEGRDVFAVEGTTPSGRKRMLYFDAEKGLLIGIKSLSPDKRPELDSLVLLGEYKQFGAVMQPTRIVQRIGPDETVTVFTSIDANVAPMRSVEPPDEIRNLK